MPRFWITVHNKTIIYTSQNNTGNYCVANSGEMTTVHTDKKQIAILADAIWDIKAELKAFKHNL